MAIPPNVGATGAQQAAPAQTNNVTQLAYTRLNEDKLKLSIFLEQQQNVNPQLKGAIDVEMQTIDSLMAKTQDGSADINFLNYAISKEDKAVQSLTGQPSGPAQGGQQGGFNGFLNDLRGAGSVGRFVADGIGVVKDAVGIVGSIFKGIGDLFS